MNDYVYWRQDFDEFDLTIEPCINPCVPAKGWQNQTWQISAIQKGLFKCTPAAGDNNPDSKVHGANIGPIRQDLGGPYVHPMNFPIG